MASKIMKKRSQKTCLNCAQQVSNLKEHLRSCRKEKEQCKLCDKYYPAGRYRAHKPVCESLKISTPEPLSEHLRLEWFNWKNKCPSTLPGLSSINFINDGTHDLWKTLPVKVDMNSHSIPTVEELYSKVFLSIQKSENFNAYEDGIEIFDHPAKMEIAGIALFEATTKLKAQQLANNKKKFGYISNLYVNGISIEPPELLRNQYRHSGPLTRLAINMSLAGTFKDLSTDMESVFSLGLGKSRNVWLIFPPTESNLRLFSNAVGESNILARIGSALKGGTVCEVNAGSALYLPAGTVSLIENLYIPNLSLISSSCVQFSALKVGFSENSSLLQQKI